MKKFLFFLIYLFQLSAGDSCKDSASNQNLEELFAIFDYLLVQTRGAPWTLWNQTLLIGGTPVNENLSNIKEIQAMNAFLNKWIEIKEKALVNSYFVLCEKYKDEPEFGFDENEKMTLNLFYRCWVRLLFSGQEEEVMNEKLLFLALLFYFTLPRDYIFHFILKIRLYLASNYFFEKTTNNLSLFSQLKKQDFDSFTFLLNVAKIENEEAKKFLKLFLLKDVYCALSCSGFCLDEKGLSYRKPVSKYYCFDVDSENDLVKSKSFDYKNLYKTVAEKLKKDPAFDFRSLRCDYPRIKNYFEKPVSLLFRFESETSDGMAVYSETESCNFWDDPF